MDAYTAEKKGLEALEKLKEEEENKSELIIALKAEIAQLKAELQAKNESVLDDAKSDEESKEEVKADQRGEQTPF